MTILSEMDALLGGEDGQAIGFKETFAFGEIEMG